MKLYGSDTDDKSSSNGSAPEPDEEQIEEEYDYSTLFHAPSYSEFIKIAPNSRARSYEKRVQSMVKAGMIASLNNQQWPDAATFLKHGPGFARAAGNLAAEDARAARVIEMLTAPESPYIMFVAVAIPLIAQLARNHQPAFEQAGMGFQERRAERRAERKQAKLSGVKMGHRTPPITVHLFKREFKLPIRFRIRFPKIRNLFKGFLAPTQNPNAIAQEVFSDPAVVKALHKMGLFPRETPNE